MNVLIGCATLLGFQLLGEGLGSVWHLPLPGPVLGMIFLAMWLAWRGLSGPRGEGLQQTSGALLTNLSLLFVPAAVGVMLHFGRLRHEWLPIATALVLSTVIGLVVTAWVVQRLAPRDEQDGGR
ncbi:MAG: CidA/LrgA family protein [Moraxellaceae bacterium]|nr:CidA/LrgA family protein [Moraxellaceae bacterium]